MDTPSQQIIAGAQQKITVKDPTGRNIVIRKLRPLDRMRLAELVGSENVKNEIYFGYASLAYHVVSMEGDPVAIPKTRLALETIVQNLGDEGLEAVGNGIKEHFLPTEVADDEAKDSIKNS